jgi:hypothetical protein
VDPNVPGLLAVVPDHDAGVSISYRRAQRPSWPLP